ncbi:hypothetical protein B0H12DRAFT_1073679 [Mycena haematopus]|nr:hypothetical protein B0H12DRAFT_1073679 [Mycena haematopus]
MYRGRAHPVFAKLLMPIHWPADEATVKEILDGEKCVTGMQLPRFIFPLDQVFPEDEQDPARLDVLDNALTGEVCLRLLIPPQSGKALLMGPESALECDGYHKGRAGKASIIGMLSFTHRVICWVVTQVHFALSSKQDWHKTDGDFDYDEVVLGKAKPRVTAAEPSGLSHLERLKALRAAKKRAVTGTTPALASAAPMTTSTGDADPLIEELD